MLICPQLLDADMPRHKTVTFNQSLDSYHSVTPDSEMYHDQPHIILATAAGWQTDPTRADVVHWEEFRNHARKAQRGISDPLVEQRSFDPASTN